ncbi:glycoside hydrolase family 130 protein [Stieleria varia]|uniref:Beta-1,4-mannooligosaccharide phosphorylase n=1 Tax=Stieleria varia TaxID=2528005 RepID=A0A5C6A520_9BACT|nr:glycoside hydrolase family 130 protein [Stieleria varia]TWT94477.1 Beta-1,4-mannooligosaccharide phosphorylase [Stieleria varia]
MSNRRRELLLFQPRDIKPAQIGYEVVGVLNPGVAVCDNGLVMLARVAERPYRDPNGLTPLPRWDRQGGIAVDWIASVDLCEIDARVVSLRRTGELRLTSTSHFQILRCSRADATWDAVEKVLPEQEYEEFGIEDPRITKIDDTYWITYVAVSKFGACTALMSSTDLTTFVRHGIIFPSENKDVVLFPHKIGGDYFALHRPNPNSHFSPPQIWISRSPDLIHWGRHEPLIQGCEPWESDRVGSGPPPILIDEGWLLLYHGSERSTQRGRVGRYAVGAALLDRRNPCRVLARTSDPIMTPQMDFEKTGFIPGVVFPTAMLDHGDTLQVFYGAADSCIAMAELSKRAVLEAMTHSIGIQDDYQRPS